jgi:hypothetical protein
MEAQRPHVNRTGYTSANPTPSVNFTSLHIEDSGTTSSRWLVDNAATIHVCNDIRLMHGVHWHPTQQPINDPSGLLRDVRSAVGSVRVRLHTGHEYTLTSVEYMPTAPNYILSVRQAIKDDISST